MLSTSRRLQWIRGVLAVLLAGAVVAALAQTPLRVPGPGTLLLVGVVYASFEGGLAIGLVAAVLAEVGLAGNRWATTGLAEPLSRSGPIVEFATFAASSVAIAILVGRLRTRAELRVQEEREHRERMAELEQVKSHFLNLASHELRGPISVARGYVSMLADGTFGPPDATDVRMAAPIVLNKLAEMNQLVDSMLDTARLEERRLVLHRVRLDLRDVVENAAQGVQPALGAKHELSVRRARHPIPVAGDAARLTIIVTNLIHNAVKYSPNGGRVECFVGVDGDRATVSVWDQGLGIAERDLPRLFTRFGRIVTAANSHIPGTGLGLYLARELARLHGGDLLVASADGRGSSFTLVLPLAEPVPPTGPPAARPEGAQTDLRARGAPRPRPPAGVPANRREVQRTTLP